MWQLDAWLGWESVLGDSCFRVGISIRNLSMGDLGEEALLTLVLLHHCPLEESSVYYHEALAR